MSFFSGLWDKFTGSLGEIGTAVGSYWGPVGSAIGGALGQAGENYFNKDEYSSIEDWNAQTGKGWSYPQLPAVDVHGNKDPSSPFPWAAAIGGLAGLGSGAMQYYGGQQANAANAEQAQKQMDFQKMMSDTSWQRGTADMKKAGLNPMLAYSQGGASSASGAAARMENVAGPAASSAMQAAQAVAGLSNTAAQTDHIEAQAENTRSETALNAYRGALIRADTEKSTHSAAQLKAATENAQAELDGIVARSRVARDSARSHISEADSRAKSAALGVRFDNAKAGAADILNTGNTTIQDIARGMGSIAGDVHNSARGAYNWMVGGPGRDSVLRFGKP